AAGLADVTRDQIEEGCFACSIRSNKAVHVAGLNRQVHAPDRDQTTEPAEQLFGAEERGHHLNSLVLVAFAPADARRRVMRCSRIGASPAMPPRLTPVRITTSRPNRIRRNSPDERKSSGVRTTTIAPIMAPGRLPRPPTTTMIRISIDLLNVKSLGLR